MAHAGILAGYRAILERSQRNPTEGCSVRV
jgi:hypothetical protein